MEITKRDFSKLKKLEIASAPKALKDETFYVNSDTGEEWEDIESKDSLFRSSKSKKLGKPKWPTILGIKGALLLWPAIIAYLIIWMIIYIIWNFIYNLKEKKFSANNAKIIEDWTERYNDNLSKRVEINHAEIVKYMLYTNSNGKDLFMLEERVSKKPTWDMSKQEIQKNMTVEETKYQLDIYEIELLTEYDESMHVRAYTMTVAEDVNFEIRKAHAKKLSDMFGIEIETNKDIIKAKREQAQHKALEAETQRRKMEYEADARRREMEIELQTAKMERLEAEDRKNDNALRIESHEKYDEYVEDIEEFKSTIRALFNRNVPRKIKKQVSDYKLLVERDMENLEITLEELFKEINGKIDSYEVHRLETDINKLFASVENRIERITELFDK